MATPTFTQLTGTANPFDGIDVGRSSDPSLSDIDGDGDLDLVVGERNGKLKYYENTGSATAPTYTERTGSANPFDGFDVGILSAPSLSDIDGDGDLDLVVGEWDGKLKYYENTGSATAPTYTERTGSANPFDGFDVGSSIEPSLSDIDGDGDPDLVVGKWDGKLSYYENTGSATAPAYTKRTGSANPFDGFDVSGPSNPSLSDIDGDGDLDLVVGEYNGKLYYVKNQLNPHFEGGDGDDTFDGSDSQHATVDYSNSPYSVIISLPYGRTVHAPNGLDDLSVYYFDTLSAIENAIGSQNDDFLVGDSGDNRLDGGAGQDLFIGGGGADTFVFSNLDSVDTIRDFSFVEDQIEIKQSALDAVAGNITAISFSFDSATSLLEASGTTINGVGLSAEFTTSIAFLYEVTSFDVEQSVYISLDGTGNDDHLMGGAGHHHIDGGLGKDTIDYSSAHQGVTVNLLTGTTTEDGFGDTDTLFNLENVVGSQFSDSITGDHTANRLTGNNGSDRLDGRQGHDWLDGGEGNDFLRGFWGNDTLYGGNDNDSVHGGDDDDELYGNSGDDYLKAGSGDDYLDGDIGEDTLHGNAGNDTLIGGAGDDTLTGGTDADIFIFNKTNGTDTITDFDASEGDKIQIETAAFGDILSVNFSSGTLSIVFNTNSNDQVVIRTDSLATLENVSTFDVNASVEFI